MQKKQLSEKEGVPRSRRKFVRNICSTALAAAASTTIPTVATAAAKGTKWSSTFDWVCVGSGAGGCGAAIFGHDKGFKTLLIEKSDTVGGLTSQSGGSVWM